MPKAEAEKKQASRSRRARTMDARKTAHKTFGTGDTAGMARWLKEPGRFDISSVDTKGKGKVSGKVKLTVAVRKRKPTMSPAKARAYLAEFRRGQKTRKRRW